MSTLVLIDGSPRPNSNSGKMLKLFAEAASKFGITCGTAVKLETMHLQMCRACLACVKTGHCVHQDGLNELMTRIEAADGLVVATPVYYGSVTAQLKTFMDRIGLLGEAHGRSLRGKLGGSITVARRWGHIAAQAEIMMWMDRCEMVHIGCGWCSATSTNANDIATDAEGLAYPARLAQNFAQFLSR